MMPFTLIAAHLLGLIAVVHAYWLSNHFLVIIGSHSIVQSFIWVGLIVAGVLSYGLFREAWH